MAEGWAKWYGRPLFEIQSAGIKTHDKNPLTINVMNEAGIDISNQESTKVTDDMLAQANLEVTVCGHTDEQCPVLPQDTKKEHWPLEEPAKAQGTEDEIIEQFRANHDDIKSRVKELLQRINTKSI